MSTSIYFIIISSLSKEPRMKQMVLIYYQFEKEYLERASDSRVDPKKKEIYLARALFCKVAQQILRNSNSSSILERCFSNALRCVSDKRVHLRNIFKLETLNNFSKQHFRSQVSKQKLAFLMHISRTWNLGSMDSNLFNRDES